MVDEYQDTSDLQENLLTLLSDNNLFAVGDIKQSIYRFRNANPAIFADRLERYSAGKEGKLIVLPDNFRSRCSVLKDINDLFLKIMTKKAGGVDYSNNHSLAYGNHGFDSSESAEKYGLHVLNYSIDHALGDVPSQAQAIARDIANKYNSKFLVRRKKDKNNKQHQEETRPCNFGDFAVLISRKSGFQEYVRAFKELGIPVSVIDDTDLKQDDFVMIFLSFLSLLRALKENRGQEEIRRYALSLARSFLVAESDENNHRLFMNGDYLKLPFIAKILEKKDELYAMDVPSLFTYFAESFELFPRLLTIGDVKENAEKYFALFNKAKEFESLGLTSMDFLTYLEGLDEYGGKFELKLESRAKNAVVLMSIHKSKGLQFPICYYSELNAGFIYENGAYFASKDYGICLPSPEDNSDSSSYLEILRKKNSHEEAVNERMRLFYVALTRAEEMMILLSPKPEIDEKTGMLEEIKLPKEASGANSFLTFFCLGGLTYPHIDADALPKTKVIIPSEGKELENDYTLSLDSVSVPFENKVAKRPSKELHEPLDPAILVKGTRLHRYMEFVDFAKKEIPFSIEDKEKAMLLKVIDLPLFDEANKAKQFHEYAFFDEESNTSGVIDCFLVYEDHIDLIDFKTSSLDEDAYSGQLESYAAYLRKIFPQKTIHKYLLSLTHAELKRVS